jgi:hypothetical protein
LEVLDYMNRKLFCLAVVYASLAMSQAVHAIPAFPGAQGYGAAATGGRGGAVYEVTNLNDSGTGSLRWALNHSGARTIVFRVSGTIHLTSNLGLYYDNVTIAGQTAPGDGICIANGMLDISNRSNVIIRYIRCRLGDCWPNGTDNDDSDGFGGRGGNNIIIDHLTASWSIDETLSLYVNTNLTVQWCMATESLYASHHAKGNHGFGGIWGSTNSSWHHNLLAHHTSRNPRIDGEVTNNVDLRNNVIYNWGYNSCYGGENATVNIVNCYYKYGPATSSGATRYRIVQPSCNTDASGNRTYGLWYITGNYMDGSATVTADNWNGGVQPDGGSGDIAKVKSTTQFPTATAYPVTTQTAQTAYNYVLASVGCSLVRDSLDTRIINEVRNRTAAYGDTYGAGTGIIDSQTSVGGWPTLNSTTAPTDTDHDGMPDAWETAHGLSPTNANDGKLDRNGDGYTNLEEYINSLCPDPYGTDLMPPTPDPMTWAVQPHAVGSDTISMTATTATDTSGVEYKFNCTYGSGHSSAWQDSPVYMDTGLTPGVYAYTAHARDKSTAHNLTAASPAITVTLSLPPDTAAPTPDPMTWSVAPYGTDLNEISMTATTAVDTSGAEYSFVNTTIAGHDSGWQDSPTYVDTGLNEGTSYSYTVVARDKSVNLNQTGVSSPAAGTTLLDIVPPTPSPMVFETDPAALNVSTVTMTAMTANDVSGVEYYFACTSGGGHDSGWQDGTSYTDTGLTNGATYAYRVMARDKSLQRNQTQWSGEVSAATPRYDCTPGILSDLDNNCMIDFADYAVFASAWSQVQPTVDHAVNGDFATDIVPGWQTYNMPSAVGMFVAAADDTTGDPANSVIVVCDTDTTGTNDHYFYQVMPVTRGYQYAVSGEWMGDLAEAGLDPMNRVLWAQVVVTFQDSPDPNTWASLTEPNSVMYGKSFGLVQQNIATTGMWAWEPLTASVVHGPADGTFTATGRYMVVAFTVGGMPSSGVGLYSLDNIKVEGPGCPAHDLNSDCNLDWLDVQVFAAQWLDCTRTPISECGQ